MSTCNTLRLVGLELDTWYAKLVIDSWLLSCFMQWAVAPVCAYVCCGAAGSK